MTWRPAKSLAVLRQEANAVAPQRRKTFDGMIGDEAHQARASRHNPNAAGVVCALDLTHDPVNGMDTYSLFDWIRLHPHPDCEYVISNQRIASRNRDWVTRAYSGSSKHDLHIHIAVGRGLESNAQPPYDDTDSWGLAAWRRSQEGGEMTAEERTRLNKCRVSDIKQSYDIAILDVKVEALAEVVGVLHWPAKVAELEAARDRDVAAEKERLGL